MSVRHRICGLALAGVATVGVAACGTPKKTASTPSAGAGSGTSTGSAQKRCTPATLPTHSKGRLTVATDQPAYPPYYQDNTPTNGKGFESAVAYAVAGRLGYSRAQVHWVTEPFDSSYAPGPKSFDFDINQISITPQRSKVVDFSTPYYVNPQAILVSSSGPYAHARSLSAFRNAKLGVQIGTTSLSAAQARIDPSSKPQVFNTSNDVVAAFKISRVNAIVVDLATAFELESEVKHSTIAGQFSAPGGDHWGLLMSKGSGLTTCVDRAVTGLRSDGTLSRLSRRWIASAAKVPQLH